jgi:hypothetical protein
MTDKSDTVKKQLQPDDHEFLVEWVKNRGGALIDLAEHFCPFPGGVEVSVTIKMRELGGGRYDFNFGDITVSREAVRKAFAEHEGQKSVPITTKHWSFA